MPKIIFRQYMSPKGRTKQMEIDRPEEICQKARDLVRHSYRLECEEFSSGRVLLVIFDPRTDQTVAIEVAQNGTVVPAAIDRLISGFVIPEGR